MNFFLLFIRLFWFKNALVIIIIQNINEIYLDFLSEYKKDFVKTLLPLISYENQNVLLERSKLDNIKVYLDNNKTLPESKIIEA